jgi:hypothetical protein
MQKILALFRHAGPEGLFFEVGSVARELAFGFAKLASRPQLLPESRSGAISGFGFAARVPPLP